MSALHKQIFEAIENRPRPVTQEQAQETGKKLIQDSKAAEQWVAWMKSNGAALCNLLNEDMTKP